MTELIYLIDSYQKELKAKVISCTNKGSSWEVVLDKTIFYPQGGGQPSDIGEISGSYGKAHVKHVRMNADKVIHECSVEGNLKAGEFVECTVDWEHRYHNMRVHSAGHIVHEAVMALFDGLIPVQGEHGKHAYIEYQGSLPIDKKYVIEKKANEIVNQDLSITTEFVSLEELKKRSSYIPEHLPTNKPLRILTIAGYQPIPDGGTQVQKTNETGEITIAEIENHGDNVRVHYSIERADMAQKELQNRKAESSIHEPYISAPTFISMLLEAQNDSLEEIQSSNLTIDELRIQFLGAKSELAKLTRQIKTIAPNDRGQVGIVVNQVKKSIEEALTQHSTFNNQQSTQNQWFDVTVPGIRPLQGHLHIVTQAIMEITRIFERIGFTRVRHPEVDWDWYAFESLNMPPNHPARDEWETFFIDYPGKPLASRPGLEATRPGLERKKQIVLTPHTSNGQVREMEKRKLPIRMINIAKCYRRQSDVSHAPMFHQFEGMYIDKGVTIGDLTGVFNFFVKNYFGPDRKIRLRPSHFQFTEPSVEIDINCGICLGTARLPNGDACRLCKGGWLEMAGGGMIHPVVLKNGGVDPDIYSGFAFGWGVERAYMMKSGTKLDDIRVLYSNDVRFLEQF
ncbi:phenylalanine--tRNA ligase subunit alpha [Candidatus Gottesmanbacteria bacterium]|nr:phenylalanine--tRNA ligase subunit alpha [Candidatus Gottesmanbacteria bacterium]